MVLPLGRNVTLYFFVAGLYLTSSMYGFVPPILTPELAVCHSEGLRRWHPDESQPLLQPRSLDTLSLGFACLPQAGSAWRPIPAIPGDRPHPAQTILPRVCALRVPTRLRCSSAVLLGVR